MFNGKGKPVSAQLCQFPHDETDTTNDTPKHNTHHASDHIPKAQGGDTHIHDNVSHTNKAH